MKNEKENPLNREKGKKGRTNRRAVERSRINFLPHGFLFALLHLSVEFRFLDPD